MTASGNVCEDEDEDGSFDVSDNCRYVSNPSQEDADSDLFGDACDNCPADYNDRQIDSDIDGIGDVREDEDEDGVRTRSTTARPFRILTKRTRFLTLSETFAKTTTTMTVSLDAVDNCPTVVNPGQENTDLDSWGDACDNCSNIANQGQEDADLYSQR